MFCLKASTYNAYFKKRCILSISNQMISPSNFLPDLIMILHNPKIDKIEFIFLNLRTRFKHYCFSLTFYYLSLFFILPDIICTSSIKKQSKDGKYSYQVAGWVLSGNIHKVNNNTWDTGIKLWLKLIKLASKLSLSVFCSKWWTDDLKTAE